VLWIGKMNSKFDFKSISSSQVSVMGDLQRLLSQGEYPPFTSAPIFESKFIQVKSNSSEIIWHGQDKIACNDFPFFFFFLLPHLNSQRYSGECPNPLSSSFLFQLLTFSLILSVEESPLVLNNEFLLFFYRFFPLKFVELSVHSTDNHHLMLKLVNGRSYYLELCAPPDQQQHLFHLWQQLISLLKPPENT
ncbi:Protein FAM71D, partial [Balearica regulorum gibbericeps]